MAQKTTVTLTCDLEGGEKPATETIGFTVEGKSYEMDVCAKHAKQFRDAMTPFVAAGRRVRSRAGRRRSAGDSDRERMQAIRAWARKKGMTVSERGRLSADIVAKYEASGGR